jgi:hypothetical protein
MQFIMENSTKKEVNNGETQNQKVNNDFVVNVGVNDFTPE